MKKILLSKPAIVIYTVLVMMVIFVMSIEYPEFKKINSFEIVSYKNDAFKARVNVGVYNGNWFSIDGENIAFSMFYKGRLVAEGQVNDPITFQRNDVTSLPMELDFYPDSMGHELKEILFADSIPVNIVLTGLFTRFGLQAKRTVPTWIKTKDLVRALVARSLENDGLKLNYIKLKSVSLEENTYQVGLDFKNTLSLPLRLKNIKYAIYADDKLQNEVANWEFLLNKEIPSLETELIEGEVVVNNVASALSGFSKMLKGSLDYYLKGYALISIHGYEIKVPIYQHFEVDPLTRKIILLEENE
jgi:LEA14-like dessication related protein